MRISVRCVSTSLPYIGKAQLSALTAPQIQRLYNDLQNGQGRKALFAKTINNLHAILHKSLKQAVTIGYIRTNPADAVVVPRVIKSEIKPLEGNEIGAFMSALENEEFRLVFLVDLYTGMRQGEVLGLTWDCVDFCRRQITVKRQLQRGKEKGSPYYFAPLKNNKTRVLTVRLR